MVKFLGEFCWSSFLSRVGSVGSLDYARDEVLLTEREESSGDDIEYELKYNDLEYKLMRDEGNTWIETRRLPATY